MKNLLKTALICAMAATTAMTMTSCDGESEEAVGNELAGKWEAVMERQSDGQTYIYEPEEMILDIDEYGTLIATSYGVRSVTYEYTYRGSILRLTGGGDEIEFKVRVSETTLSLTDETDGSENLFQKIYDDEEGGGSGTLSGNTVGFTVGSTGEKYTYRIPYKTNLPDYALFADEHWTYRRGISTDGNGNPTNDNYNLTFAWDGHDGRRITISMFANYYLPEADYTRASSWSFDVWINSMQISYGAAQGALDSVNIQMPEPGHFHIDIDYTDPSGNAFRMKFDDPLNER